MFEKLIAKGKITFVDDDPIIGPATAYPLDSPSDDLIPSRKAAIDHAVDHVIWHISDKPVYCGYCKSPIAFETSDRKIKVTLRRVTVRRPVPEGAKDLRLADHEGWLADLEHRGRNGKCSRCGLRHDEAPGNWGLMNPRYGSSGRTFLFRTRDGFTKRNSTLPVRRYSCFSADTHVLVPGAGSKSISQIVPGDVVCGYDLERGRTEADVVTACYAGLETQCFLINGALQITQYHPILTQADEWKRAGELIQGDWVRGTEAAIRIASIARQTAQKRVFNFEVATNHSYCVSGDRETYFVVHNGK